MEIRNFDLAAFIHSFLVRRVLLVNLQIHHEIPRLIVIICLNSYIIFQYCIRMYNPDRKIIINWGKFILPMPVIKHPKYRK